MADMKNMNLAITVDDGARRVPILNMDGEEIGSFRFHPTDIGIIERYNRLAEQFDAISEPLEGLSVPEGGEMDLTDPKLVAALTEAESRLNAAVNKLFGSDGAAEAFFGRMHPFSPVNGEFYATQVLQKVGAFIGAQFDTETRAMSKKAKKYLK
ncbi:MAG: hypothetical protein IKE17_15635 [Clostridia bacterium]|nr:hypothetical protein [Clostridia bacterium]MBR2799152.1 hypothetical protein [Clostridia bacterium]